MSDAKARVRKRIRNKIKNNKRTARRFVKRVGIQTITANFVNKLEEIKELAEDAISFQQLLERETQTYHRLMQHVDPEISIALNWYKEEDTASWQDLRLEGVTISWSRFYLGKHPLIDRERYIDVAELWMQGYFENEE